MLKYNNSLAKKYFRDEFGTNSLESEEECLDKNNIYVLIKSEYSKSPIYKNFEKYKNQHILFIESFISEIGLCLSIICKDFYINHYTEIFRNISEKINKLLQLDNTEIFGINYKINETTNYEKEENNKGFNNEIIFLYYYFSF